MVDETFCVTTVPVHNMDASINWQWKGQMERKIHYKAAAAYVTKVMEFQFQEYGRIKCFLKVRDSETGMILVELSIGQREVWTYPDYAAPGNQYAGMQYIATAMMNKLKELRS
jgi:hypothetical protein